MTVCPIAIAVGCKKCPAFSICPLKGVLGDVSKPGSEAAQPAKPKPKAHGDDEQDQQLENPGGEFHRWFRVAGHALPPRRQAPRKASWRAHLDRNDLEQSVVESFLS